MKDEEMKKEDREKRILLNETFMETAKILFGGMVGGLVVAIMIGQEIPTLTISQQIFALVSFAFAFIILFVLIYIFNWKLKKLRE